MKKIECAVCGEETAAAELLEHIHAQHIGPHRHNYCCRHCSFLSTDANALLLHANKTNHLPLKMKVMARDYVNDLAEKILRDSLEFGSKRVTKKRKLDETRPPEAKKICKLCECSVPKNESSFLQHVTRFHCNSPLNCPYCPHFEGHTWNKLTKHIKKKHRSKTESFNLADMEDASQLQDKVRECFKKKHKSPKTTPPQQEEVQIAFDSTTESVLCQNLEATLGKLSCPKAAVELEALCAICGASTQSKWNHVSKHLSDDKSSHTTYKMYRQCFPEEDANICVLCRKFIHTGTGTSFHTAVFHHQKSLTCPHCSQTELHNWNINKHLKERHPDKEYKCFQPPEDWTKGLRELVLLCFPRRKTKSAFVQSSLEVEAEQAARVELDPIPTPPVQGSESTAAPESTLTVPLTEQQETLKEERNTPQPELPVILPSPTPIPLPLLDPPPVSSEKTSVAESSSSKDPHSWTIAVSCQLCNEPMFSFRCLEKHVWLTHLRKRHTTFSCSGCGARSYSVKFFRHLADCPAQKVSPCVGYKVRSVFVNYFFRCFPWPFIRDMFNVSFRNVAAPKKEK